MAVINMIPQIGFTGNKLSYYSKEFIWGFSSVVCWSCEIIVTGNSWVNEMIIFLWFLAIWSFKLSKLTTNLTLNPFCLGTCSLFNYFWVISWTTFLSFKCSKLDWCRNIKIISSTFIRFYLYFRFLFFCQVFLSFLPILLVFLSFLSL